MYVVIATVTCQGGADFSGILTLKRLFHALAAAPGKKKRLFFKVPPRQWNPEGCRICSARKTFPAAPRNKNARLEQMRSIFRVILTLWTRPWCKPGDPARLDFKIKRSPWRCLAERPSGKKHTMATLKWPPTSQLSRWREKWSHLSQNAPPPYRVNSGFFLFSFLFSGCTVRKILLL